MDTVRSYMNEKLCLTPTPGDQSVYLQDMQDKSGSSGALKVYVFDKIGAADGDFESVTTKVSSDLESKEGKWNKKHFFEMLIRRKNEDSV